MMGNDKQGGAGAGGNFIFYLINILILFWSNIFPQDLFSLHLILLIQWLDTSSLLPILVKDILNKALRGILLNLNHFLQCSSSRQEQHSMHQHMLETGKTQRTFRRTLLEEALMTRRSEGTSSRESTASSWFSWSSPGPSSPCSCLLRVSRPMSATTDGWCGPAGEWRWSASLLWLALDHWEESLHTM